ncbi:MAG: hypothetical protein L0Y54_18165 [Sporichthyaceae bacterium]|nr:hypothetical protein [Sporichthyaceae bacterium]
MAATESPARRMWRLFEPIHAITYFAPETRAATDALGLRGGWMSYFGCRAAPLGAASAGLVTATFYNFHPDMVARAVPDVWDYASPAKLLATRLEAMDAAMRRLMGAVLDSDAVAEAATLAREAAEATDLAGRPLGAANAALPWPDQPHLALWQATTVLREHRGDGHIAALLTAGLGPLEAHVSFSAVRSDWSSDAVRTYRKWSELEWAEAVGSLRDRGWLDEQGHVTTAGQHGRANVERMTDQLAERPWSALGPARTNRLAELLRPLATAVFAGRTLPVPNPWGLAPPDN